MIKGIIGAVIGDIAGSSRESKPVSRKTFKLFTKDSSVTDDTALTVAIAEWMLDREGVDVGQSLIKWATEYPHAGYGSSFKRFLAHGSHMTPGSTHNGAVMRVSPVGFLASSLEECLELSRESALPSHVYSSCGSLCSGNCLRAIVAWKSGLSGEFKTLLEGRCEESYGTHSHDGTIVSAARGHV